MVVPVGKTVHVAGGIIKFNHVDGHIVVAHVYERPWYSRSRCLSDIEQQFRAQWLNISPRKYAVTPHSANVAKYYRRSAVLTDIAASSFVPQSLFCGN